MFWETSQSRQRFDGGESTHPVFTIHRLIRRWILPQVSLIVDLRSPKHHEIREYELRITLDMCENLDAFAKAQHFYSEHNLTHMIKERSVDIVRICHMIEECRKKLWCDRNLENVVPPLKQNDFRGKTTTVPNNDHYNRRPVDVYTIHFNQDPGTSLVIFSKDLKRKTGFLFRRYGFRNNILKINNNRTKPDQISG
ncbi:hypothetical protein HZH68_005981 [Vespula germanica]|uniref:Uncharacterized protein n=1 Tax=Vespula germanica TaxID=30212 RepID=A0A834NBI5_VESGE|nr:hypothetical protein HZH68_005981 [Vespula germanica]